MQTEEEEKRCHSRPLDCLTQVLLPLLALEETLRRAAGLLAVTESTRPATAGGTDQFWNILWIHSSVWIPSSQCGFTTQHYNDSLCYRLFQDQSLGLCIEMHRTTTKISKSVDKRSSFGRNGIQRAATKPRSAGQQGIGVTAWTRE